MKPLFVLFLLSAVIRSVSGADGNAPTEIKSAVTKLGEKSNYSWISTPKSEGASANLQLGSTEGKTEKNGFTYFKLTVGQNTVEAAFKGAKSAIKTENDWEPSQALQGDRAWVARRLTAFKAPVAEAEDLLAKVQGLRKEIGNVYAGDLSQSGVKELLSMRARDGQNSMPTGAKGWAKFWVRDNMLVRYQYNVQGKLMGQNQQESDINRTTTVEIKDVGSTTVQLPDEAKKKL